MHIDETLIAILIFALIFLCGFKLRLPGNQLHRWVLSFAAGVAVAYVFVHLIPQLHVAKKLLVNELTESELNFSEHIVYLMAMLGFILSYGLEKMASWSHLKINKGDLMAEKHKITFSIHLIGYSVYVFLVGYLMIRNIEAGAISIVLYTVAFGFHFLGLDFYFYDEYRRLYKKTGRYILSAAVMAGWCIGSLTEIHKILVILLLGFISGAIIMSSIIMELPQDKDGKFWPFLLGGIFYSLLLVTIG